LSIFTASFSAPLPDKLEISANWALLAQTIITPQANADCKIKQFKEFPQIPASRSFQLLQFSLG